MDPSPTRLKVLAIVRWLGSLTGLAICLGIYVTCQLPQAHRTFLPDGVYFVDADCYSRMTRVHLVMDHPGIIIHHHEFENYPDGLHVHTTAPFDYLIAGMSWLTLQKIDLDVLGALVSPLLGALLIVAAWWWSRGRRYGWAMLIILATSPILLHGFSVGRPDHQSLILLLCGLGLMAEASLWQQPSKSGSILWGVSWGVAMWVSLFEPIVLLAVILAVRFAVWRKACLKREWWPSLILAGLIVLLSIGLEGWPTVGLDPKWQPYFFRWASRIGELQATNPIAASLAWGGWLSLLLPFALIGIGWKRREKVAWLWLALLLSNFALTAWHVRFGYFLALSIALAMPLGLSCIRYRWIGYTLFVVALWPMMAALESTLFPEGDQAAQRAQNLIENVALRQVAQLIRPLPGDGIVAPWWLTPEAAYWSGKNGVAGSSHESMPGIVATEDFFATQDESVARKILQDRKASFVIVCDSDRLLDNINLTLGQTPYSEKQMAAVLFRAPSRAPSFLQLIFSNRGFKVYRVRDLEDLKRPS